MAPASANSQKRRFCSRPATSGLPLQADLFRALRHFRTCLVCSSAPNPSDPQPPNLTTKRQKTDIPTLLSADILALRLQIHFARQMLWKLDGRCPPHADRRDFGSCASRLSGCGLCLLDTLRRTCEQLRKKEWPSVNTSNGFR